MKILYVYLIKRVLSVTLLSSLSLTCLLVLGNVYQRVFDLMVNNDVPFGIILKMVALLVPFALTFTLPWSLLIGVMLTFGRMSHDLELQSIRSSGVGLVPLIAPVILLSLVMTIICFYNNAIIAPNALRTFKLALVDISQNTPTVLIKAREPIDTFDGYRIWVGRKQGNQVFDVHIWQLNDDNLPVNCIRAEEGKISADLQNYSIGLALLNARQEKRGPDPTQLNTIQTGIRANRLPVRISLEQMRDKPNINRNRSLLTINELQSQMFSENSPAKQPGFSFVAILTEIQKRVSFSFAPFTFVLVGIPLAIRAHRREVSVGLALSLAVVLLYYLITVFAEGFKEKAAFYPELIMWLPNIIFQVVGFYLIWKANRHPV
ncbi:MAG: LptF/LptG family permease [Verrucomicrobiota bacterium]